MGPHDILRCGSLQLKVAWTTGSNASAETQSSNLTQSEPIQKTPAAKEPKNDLILQTVTAMAQAVELRDKSTGGHTQRVTNYALLLAEELDLPSHQRRFLQIGTPLHDIGKIGVDDAILRKTGKLSAEEFEAMKAHTVTGASILETISELRPILPIVRSHHEPLEWHRLPRRSR